MEDILTVAGSETGNTQRMDARDNDDPENDSSIEFPSIDNRPDSVVGQERLNDLIYGDNLSVLERTE